MFRFAHLARACFLLHAYCFHLNLLLKCFVCLPRWSLLWVHTSWAELLMPSTCNMGAGGASVPSIPKVLREPQAGIAHKFGFTPALQMRHIVPAHGNQCCYII